MTSVQMDVKTYLTRIGFEGPPEPTLDTLRAIHICHLQSVPFENLTVHSGGQIHLDLSLFYDKIVTQRRGGFCYEVNGLFSWLLSKLGFQVTLLSAQVRAAITGFFGPRFDHLLLMVTLEGHRWLCDVACGSVGFFHPLSLETDDLQEQGHRVYRMRRDNSTGLYFVESQQEENKGANGDWTQIYKFTFDPQCLEDFTRMCHYHQTSPSSLFFCKSLCTILTPRGRLTYIGHKLTTTTFPSEETGGVLETETRELKDEEIPHVLEEKFGIILKSPLIPKDEAVIPPPDMY